MTIEFVKAPKQISAPSNVTLSNKSFKICDQIKICEISSMIAKGAIEPISSSEDCFASSFFRYS